MPDFRIERDSMGEVSVHKDALYAAQTQRAVDNFQISGISFSRSFIRALGLVKQACAQVNLDLDSLDAERAGAIVQAAGEVADGKWDEHFPIDIFQPGPGTPPIPRLGHSAGETRRAHPGKRPFQGLPRSHLG